MKRLTVVMVTCLLFVSLGCAVKKSPVLTPLLPNIVGEYEFVAVGLGAGHGYMSLPGLAPNPNNDMYEFLLPDGKFIFNQNGTFKIVFGLATWPVGGEKTSFSDFPFIEVDGVYTITSEHTINMETKYKVRYFDVSKYLYSIINLSQVDSKGEEFYTSYLQLMPVDPQNPLWVGDSSSPQGTSLLDYIKLMQINTKKAQ